MKPKTRCLYQDPDCGGTDINGWRTPYPHASNNISTYWKSELNSSSPNDNKHHEFTILSIPENHNLGKTDTWFTYVSMLTRSRPDLHIDFVGKLDGDNMIHFPTFVTFLYLHQDDIDNHPYIHGGYVVPKGQCIRQKWGKLCARPEFIAPMFVTGAISYLSTPLAQHVYMDGTTLAHKRNVWIHFEDAQLSNMAYSDPNITHEEVLVLNHRGRPKPGITQHCSGKPNCVRERYHQAFPELHKVE